MFFASVFSTQRVVIVKTANENLAALRSRISGLSDGIIIPKRSCSFRNTETVVTDIEFISGFTGSNGVAFISQDVAILSVDGRYQKQATSQVDNDIWEIVDYPKVTITDMVKNFDGSVAMATTAHSYKTYETLRKNYNIVPVEVHPIFDLNNKLRVNDVGLEISGVRNALEYKRPTLVSDSALISWMFGIRRSKPDNYKNMVPHMIAFVDGDKTPIIFCDLKLFVADAFFSLYDFKDFENVMRSHVGDINIDCTNVPAYFAVALKNLGFKIADEKSDSSRVAVKNSTEIEAHKDAAFKTSLSFIKTLAYVDHFVSNSVRTVTEQDAISLFEHDEAVDYSFAPISASDVNTSIVHYSDATSVIKNNSLFLFDAGFHFKDATTDMTRTIYIGDNPSQNFKKIYTAILKSIIFYSMAQFPSGTRAVCLDAICRYNMWSSGLDYNFGTGHGIGNHRNVHEFPSISRRSSDAIVSNMVTTVEPGYYEDGFGIRMENMLLTVDYGNDMVRFETLNYVPFCAKLIEKGMLSNDEVKWLNEYNAIIAKKCLCMFDQDSIVSNWILRNML